MNDEELRCWFAGCVLVGLIMRDKVCDAEEAWFVADKMIEARNQESEQEVGIVAAKPRRKKSA
jgi:hypothetical protein